MKKIDRFWLISILGLMGSIGLALAIAQITLTQ
jgi:hypothetical protein